MAEPVVPFVPAKTRLPEITVKAVILGVVLSVLLGAANTYLGLRVGMTVSASIPAAVVSMALLRLFRRRNILENNLVQTSASAGESLAAGILFTLPALLILGYWTQISYVEVTAIALAGGALGVFFTIPLRRALIVEMPLTFPEGVATAEVLKAGEGLEKSGAGPVGIVALIVGALVGAAYKYKEGATKLWTESAIFGRRFGDGGVFAFGGFLSPALLGVGYIIGLRIAALVFMGGVIGWAIGIPLYSLFGDPVVALPDGTMIDVRNIPDVVAAAGVLWSSQIRYMGVGAMLVGGLWTVLQLRRPLAAALGFGRRIPRSVEKDVPRTEQSIGMRATFLGVALLSVPLTLLYWYATQDLGAALVLGVIMVVSGFLFSAVAAYMAGLVGSSSNPISGVTIITVLFTAFTLRLLGIGPEIGPAATIFVAGTIAAAAAIGGDNMQDLKAGYLLGATPRKQQIMQFVGVGAAALTIAFVLQILTTAYQLGSQDLAAPQASLMAAVADIVFGNRELPVTMVVIGGLIAIAVILGDEALRVRGSSFRMPIMAVAVGIYLPVGLTLPIFLGGLIAWGTARAMRREPSEARRTGHHNGILFGSGLIAGEALIGIGIAGLFVAHEAIAKRTGFELREFLALRGDPGPWPGIVLYAFLAALLAYFVVRGRLVKAGSGSTKR